MTPAQIKTALLACFNGNVFTAPDTLFGSGTLKAAFDRSLPDGTLAMKGTLSEADGAIVVAGAGRSPFLGMTVSAAFSPQGDDVLLVATGTGTFDWGFATAFPSLAGSLLAQLSVADGAALVLRTISDDQHPAGLGFKGAVGVGGPLEQAAKFIGAATSLDFSGPITFTLGAPSFTLSAPVASPFSLGPLQNLGIAITLTAIPTGAGTATGAIGASTAVAVVVNGRTATLPASIDFSGGSSVDLKVTAPAGSGVTLADLAGFALGGDLSSLLPPKAVYDVADALALDEIDFTIAPLVPSLTKVTFSLSSAKPWTIGSKFTVVGVDMSLVATVAASTSLSGSVSGALQVGDNGSICSLDASATLPEGTFAATLDPKGARPNVSDLVTFLAGDFGLPAITVSALQVSLTPATSDYSLSATFSTDWSIGVGDFGLAVTGASIDLASTGGNASGKVSGTLVLNQNNKFDLSYAIPGGFKLVAQVPGISLSGLVGALCRAVGAPPPGFDFSFTDATILITKDGEQFVLSFGAQLETYGSAALVVQHGASGWTFAFGILLDTAALGALPGLDLLSIFDSAFGLEEVAVVFGTLTDSTFAFPAMSSFDNPSIKAPKVTSPGWTGGMVAGLNIYAMLDLGKSEILGWLCKLVDFDARVAMTLQVPEDPATGTILTAEVSGKVSSNMILTGGFVAKLVGGNLDLGLIGIIPTTISGHAVTFTIEVDFQANGIFISGSTPDTIDFGVVELGALAIELGVDGEGIPSIGVAATIQVGTFDSSIAIFFDSANPAQSLFSGSISDVTLDTVMAPIVGVTSLPSEIDAILKQVALAGTAKFTLPATLAASLDARDKAAVIAAFAAAGVPLDSDPKAVSILGGKAQGAWAITDLSTLTHYHLSQSGNGPIAAEKEAQVKFVPQTTQIGSLPPVTGPVYAMSGALSVFGLTGIVDIDIEPATGISIDASLSPVHFLNDKLLTITDATDPAKGPHLSLSTFLSGPTPPHATASGKATLLGLVGESVSIDISPSGASFALGSEAPVYSYSIDVTLNKSGFAANGSAQVGFDETVDLGLLGSLPIDVMIGGTIGVSFDGTAASAGFSGSFTFQGHSFSTGAVTLDVTAASLENLASELVSAVIDAVKGYLLGALNPAVWLNWVKNNIIPNLAADAKAVGRALGSAFNQSADQIANLTHSVLGYSADAAAAAIQAANFTADAAATALAGAGYAADAIASAIKNAFTSHADTSVHIDTPAGPHVDASPHADTPAGPHADTAIPPHGDAAPHLDTPAGPHADSQVPPHADTAPHLDTPGGPHADVGGGHVDSHQDVFGIGPHEDFGAPHVDSQVPPHIDASPHVDTPAGPHADSQIPPHVDTAPHADTPAGPHTDTPVPPHIDGSKHADANLPPHVDGSQHIDVQP